ncbi:LD-carboxypeptidase [Paenibacillus sp. UNC499MF]|uniref:S66 peptidase family protein n=1 Tax=Paenibacillus sp. UNC499MF TaxID=1502751 RepID=UPI0008A04CA1|nr:LD-carboxypeptidase [Paenibacillus sp. UNC499MF]SEG14998.1 muramoyltetrapeptide carboxypeptidase [Paenibacillus sp. UNC499MF]
MAIKPVALLPGDTVGIVTLGSPLSAETIQARIAYLQSLGLKVLLGRYVYSANGYLAGTDRERAEDFMSVYADPRVKMILPTRGGVGVADILPYLDYAFIRQNPKIVTGYSDITVLLNTLYKLADLITFHSLLLIDFRPDTPSYNFEQFFTATSSIAAPRPIANPPGIPLIGRVPGSVSGPVIGGNLTSLVGSLGTPFEVDTTGKILLLEETHEPVNTVYRYVDQLRLAGKFQACAGIVMGECTNCQTAYGKTYEDLISEVIVPLGKPLLTNLASGHGLYKAAIPIGANVNLNASAAALTLLEAAVRY